MNAKRSDVRVWSRGQSYGVVAGVVAGMLFAGLAVPLVFGTERGADTLGSDGPAPLSPVEAAGPLEPGSVESTGPLAGPSAGATAPGSVAGVPAPGQPQGAPGATSGGSGSTSGGTTGSAPGAKPTASDRGVTATTIKLGVVLLDLSAVTPLGLGLDNYELETQKKAFETYIEDVNKTGGMHGRKVVPFYDTIDPLDSNGRRSAQAVCKRLVIDEKVFAVTGFPGAAGQCASVQYQTPTIAGGADLREAYAKSKNYYTSGYPTFERMAEDWAGYVDSAGLLKSRKLGIFSASASPEVKAADALDARLKRLGYTITYRTKLADQSQMAIEVNKMKAAGVNTVLLPTNFLLALQFVQSADDQGWKPQYIVSDIGNLTANGLVERMSSGFDNAIGVTTTREFAPAYGPESPIDNRCRTLYNSDNDGKDFARSEESPLGPACLAMQLVLKGVQKAGVTLTRAGFVSALMSLGSVELPVFGQGSFRQGKTDFADTVRPLKWSYSCRCYAAIGGPVPVRS